MEYTESTSDQIKKNRMLNATYLSKIEHNIKSGMSQRQAANHVGVARSSARHWKSRASKIPLPSTVVNFFESPDGAEFLDCLITALQFVMNQVGSCGIRLVSLVLELSNLHHFVASSYESLRRRGLEMEEHIVNFGEQEKTRLAKTMPPKKITVAEDETFHPKPCLVAMDPVSNFILVEQYSEKRDADSWNTVMDVALEGLPVDVIQSTSDEARGILNHATQHMLAHHSPDIFHVQQDITKATSAAMASRVSAMEKKIEALEKEGNNRGKTPICAIKKGRPSLLSCKSEEELASEIKSSKSTLSVRQAQQTAIKDAKKDLGTIYHPYDIENGNKRTPEKLQQALAQRFETIENNVTAAKLKESSTDKIAKAKKVCSGLVATLAFFWVTIQQIIESYSLSKPLETLLYDQLMPAQYLMIASQKAKRPDDRKSIAEQGEKFIDQLNNNIAWKNLNDKEQEQLTNIAKDCAQVFQRSSSCLEGRNGYLSLRHHGLHHISDRKLNALTVIHNYFIERPDGSIAAERFFEKRPRSLFKYLRNKMPSVPRPARKRTNFRQVA
jgi:hypothetical protein